MIEELKSELKILANQQRQVEKDVTEVKAAVKDIAASLQILTELKIKDNERHEALKRAFNISEDHENRLRILENSAPINKIANGLLFKSTLWLMGLLGTLITVILSRGLIS